MKFEIVDEIIGSYNAYNYFHFCFSVFCEMPKSQLNGDNARSTENAS